jgi:hypothetical protein
MTQADYEMTLDGYCTALPEAVYGVLADLSTHLDWGGRGQRRTFRLTALEPAGPVREGTRFTSAGTIPMSRAHWSDESVVVRAEAPRLLEFHTDGVAVGPRGQGTRVRWEHRYAIEPEGTGCRVTYRLRRTSITRAPLRMRVPVMRTVTHRVMIPFLCRRGFTNLLALAQG